jgi:hypothetical protein
MARARQTVPNYAIGCMDRSYITIDGGERDPSIAIWIQTESQYFDLRIRHDRPKLQHLRSLEEFKREDFQEIAKQSGDTGVCTIVNDVATWASFGGRFGFYCNDVASFPDDGRLEARGNILYEYDTPKSDFRYEEAWVGQPYDHGLIAHLTLVEEENPKRELASLVVTGRYAGFVERSTSDDESPLEAQLEAAGSDLSRMRDILNCEASYAIRPRADAPFVIRHSTLPFREGKSLDVPVMNRQVLKKCEMEQSGTLPADRDGAIWRVESWFVHS